MKKISDERLEQMLTAYCKAESGQSFVVDPDHKREKLIPFGRFSRTAAVAAGLILVSVLSLTVYFSFGNKINTPIAVTPSPQSAITPSAPAGESGGDPQQDAPEPTQPKSLWQNIVDFLFPQLTDNNSSATNRISPTENSGTVNNRTSPTQSNRKPAAPFATEALKPKPTQKTGENATETPVVQPTDILPIKPTEILPEPTVPCDPPSNDPTEGSPYPLEPEPTDPPGEGDEPGYMEPTQPPEGGLPYEYTMIEWFPASTSSSTPQGELIVTFQEKYLNADGLVYCRLFDNHKNYGEMLGHPNPFDSSHTAVVTGNYYSEEYGWLTTASYTLPEGLVPESGNYHVKFYNSSGRFLGRLYVDL